MDKYQIMSEIKDFDTFCQKVFDEYFYYNSQWTCYIKMSELSRVLKQDKIVMEFAALAGFRTKNARTDVVRVFKLWLQYKYGITYKVNRINGKPTSCYLCLQIKQI